MGDAIDDHTPDAIFNSIQNTVSTHTEAVRVRVAFEFFGLRSSRGFNQPFDGLVDVVANLTR